MTLPALIFFVPLLHGSLRESVTGWVIGSKLQMFDPIMTQKLLEPSTYKALSPIRHHSLENPKLWNMILSCWIVAFEVADLTGYTSIHFECTSITIKTMCPKTVLHSLAICNCDQGCDGHCHGCNGLGGGPGRSSWHSGHCHTRVSISASTNKTFYRTSRKQIVLHSRVHFVNQLVNSKHLRLYITLLA